MLGCFDHFSRNWIIPGLISLNSLGHRLKAGDGETRAVPPAWRMIAQRSNSASAGIIGYVRYVYRIATCGEVKEVKMKILNWILMTLPRKLQGGELGPGPPVGRIGRAVVA